MTQAAALAHLSLDDLLSVLTGVKASGSGHTAKCPAHEDNRNSLSITQGDDGKILLHCHAGCSFEAITDALNIDPRQLMGEPAYTGKPRIVATYDYTDAAGTLLYQAVRFQPKDFRQRRLADGARASDPDSKDKWLWNLKGIAPTLFHLPDLMAAIAAKRTVFIVEGEKDVLSLGTIGLTATCNSGGAGKFPKDIAALFTGANVVILPDNDAPGRNHAQDVAQKLKKHAARIRIVTLPGLPAKGDVSDWITAGGTREQIIALVKAAPVWTPETAPKTEPEPQRAPVTVAPTAAPFRFLGFNDSKYYYLPREDLQIIGLSPDQHTQACLISIAPLAWWETTFPGGKTTPVDWNAARNWLFRTSKKAGIYDIRRLRGCGAWFDEGRVVQHNGDRLIVDGESTAIESLATRHIYNASFPIDVAHSEPCSTASAFEFLKICRMPSWEKPVNGTLLAGWCVVAPICGALSWRPHAWITGASGTGKTWIMDNIVKPVVGTIALHAQANTTEAGIRQRLGINAFPVIFDETEGEDSIARKRLQGVLELMRQASSETGAPIIKGGQSGHAVEFRVRSCFILSSVGVNITQRADSSRVTVITLARPHPQDAADLFDDLKAAVGAIMTPAWCASLRSRTLGLIPVIFENAGTFSRAAAERFSDQRIGDQLGALLAGAYSLTSERAVTLEFARKWIDEHDWRDQSSIDEVTDETRCINRILEQTISYSSFNERVEQVIGEILYNAAYRESTIPAIEALERIGIKLNSARDMVIISDSHAGIAKILRDTPWERTWGRILKRVKDVQSSSGVRFNGTCHRATLIPAAVIFSRDSNEGDA